MLTSITSMNLEESFNNWKVDEVILNNVRNMGIDSLFPVQKALIPYILFSNFVNDEGARDVCVSSPTGSGKTLAFLLPIVQILHSIKADSVKLQAMVVLPTRELANQVFTVAKLCTVNLKVFVSLATGSRPIEEERNDIVGLLDDNSLVSKAHVLIGTPGRLLEHIDSTVGFSLEHLKFLVLDEADRLLGNASHFWLRSLIRKRSESFASSEKLQKFLFSATLSDNPSMLHMLGIKNPVIFHVKQSVISGGDTPLSEWSLTKSLRLPGSLSEFVCVCESAVKPLYLIGILHDCFYGTQGTSSSESHYSSCLSKDGLCVIFASSTEATERLYKLLSYINDSCKEEGGVFKGRIVQMSSTLSAEQRSEHMNLILHSGDAFDLPVRIIVCSDQFARGIDLPNIKVVINYDPPTVSNTYIHRAGRTARANKKGFCISLLKAGGQVGTFRKMRYQIEADAAGISTDFSKKRKREEGEFNHLGLIEKLLLKCQPSTASLAEVESVYRSAISFLRNNVE